MADIPSVVRLAGEADVPSLTALVNAAYLVEAFFKKGDRTSVREISELMQKGDFLVIDAGDRLQGCVYVEVERERGYLGMLSVAPSSQKQGLGARLVDAAEAFCRSAGCRRMELEVVNLRTELPPYYRRFGYAESGIREFPHTADWMQRCHFIVMRKPL